MFLPEKIFFFKPLGFKKKMDISEAKQILNIQNMNQDTLDNAYRLLLKENHPDRNGSHYIASKINEANTLIKRAIKMRELKNKESIIYRFFKS